MDNTNISETSDSSVNDEEHNHNNIPINPLPQNPNIINNLNVLSQIGFFQNNSMFHNQQQSQHNFNIASLFYPLINIPLNINSQDNQENNENNENYENDEDNEDNEDYDQENINIHEEHEYNEDHENHENHDDEHVNENNQQPVYYYDPYALVSNMVNQNPNYDNEINNKIIEVMNDASNILFTSSEELINIINLSYLSNLQYSDELMNTIRYTIRTIFRDTTQYEIKDVVAGILTYSLSDINVIFNENYDLIYNIIQEELKRIYHRSYTMSLLSNIFNVNNVNNSQMENVKLTIKPEIIENIPKRKFKDCETKIKDINSKCTVCQASFENDDEIRILPCEHIYHIDCIDNWLTNYNYLCPCCREPAAEHFANIS
jgi:hypothetical protein